MRESNVRSPEWGLGFVGGAFESMKSRLELIEDDAAMRHGQKHTGS